jgi:DNA-binding transcriptional MerR regulator
MKILVTISVVLTIVASLEANNNQQDQRQRQMDQRQRELDQRRQELDQQQQELDRQKVEATTWSPPPSKTISIFP